MVNIGEINEGRQLVMKHQIVSEFLENRQNKELIEIDEQEFV
jgi:hypothetical protein